MPHPHPRPPAEPAALVAAAEQVATIRIIRRLEEQLKNAAAEATRLQQVVDAMPPPPAAESCGEANEELQAAMSELTVAKERENAARAQLVETKELLVHDATAPPEFSELRERVASLAKHPRFQRQAAKVGGSPWSAGVGSVSGATNSAMFDQLLHAVTSTGQHQRDDSGSDGFNSAGSDTGDSTEDRQSTISDDAPNWSSEEDPEPAVGADARTDALRAQSRRLEAMRCGTLSSHKRPEPEPEPEPEPQPQPQPQPEPTNRTVGASQSTGGTRDEQPDEDVFYDMVDGSFDHLLDSPLTMTNCQSSPTGSADTDVHAARPVLAELDRKTRDLATQQLAAVVALQHAREERARAAYKELEVVEKESLATALLAELEAEKESIDSFFAKQAIREKVETAAAERTAQEGATRLATARVNACVERLVEITLQVKCFRLNADVLRRRCAQGPTHSQEEEERTLATRVEQLQALSGPLGSFAGV